jgi:hypothetical protein
MVGRLIGETALRDRLMQRRRTEHIEAAVTRFQQNLLRQKLTSPAQRDR